MHWSLAPLAANWEFIVGMTLGGGLGTLFGRWSLLLLMRPKRERRDWQGRQH